MRFPSKANSSEHSAYRTFLDAKCVLIPEDFSPPLLVPPVLGMERDHGWFENVPLSHAVYLWTWASAESPQTHRSIYVGQSVDLRQRTVSHLNSLARGSMWREGLAIQKRGASMYLSWCLYLCDCLLDSREGTLIRLLEPYRNSSPGQRRSRPAEHDVYCTMPRDSMKVPLL